MALVDDLPTPCLLIDEQRMERNLARMQARIDGAALRPHTKTHKMVRLARRQVALGAHGLTVAKPSEAAVLVESGLGDVRVAYTVVCPRALEHIATLTDRARVTFCIDTLDGARRASAVFGGMNRMAEVMLEIDAGYGRCGVAWDDPGLVDFVRSVHGLPAVKVVGILTHEGNAYTKGLDAIRSVMARTRDRMLKVACQLHAAGLAAPGSFEISVGSTPSMTVFENRNMGGFRITEIRPGNYIFHDRTQVELGVCSWDDCALTVLTTVVSRHRTTSGTERFFLDAGRKVFTSDLAPGSTEYGRILYNASRRVPHPHARLTGLSEEHGWGAVRGGGTLSVGDRIEVIPNHACTAVNTQSHASLIRDAEVIDRLPVDARGCVT